MPSCISRTGADFYLKCISNEQIAQSWFEKFCARGVRGGTVVVCVKIILPSLELDLSQEDIKLMTRAAAASGIETKETGPGNYKQCPRNA
jgi:hypothetical protein